MTYQELHCVATNNFLSSVSASVLGLMGTYVSVFGSCFYPGFSWGKRGWHMYVYTPYSLCSFFFVLVCLEKSVVGAYKHTASLALSSRGPRVFLTLLCATTAQVFWRCPQFSILVGTRIKDACTFKLPAWYGYAGTQQLENSVFQ